MVPCVWASEVAAIVGRNKYKPATVAIGELRGREFGATTVVETKARSPRRAVAEVKNADAATQEMAAETARQHLNDDVKHVLQSNATLRIAVSTGESIDTEAVADLSPRLQKAIMQKSQMTHGILQEKECLDEMQAKLGCVIHSQQKKYKRTLTTQAGNRFVLFGKIDGMQTNNDGSQFLVETKKRKTRLFHCVPDYELVQVHAYMFLTRMDRAILNENFQGTSLQHVIEFDTMLWQNVQEKLCECVDHCFMQIKMQ